MNNNRYINRRYNNSNGFIGPFILGGITGTLISPLLYNNRPYYNNGYYYPIYYPPYRYY